MMPVKFQGGSSAGPLGELHRTSCCCGYGWGSLSLSANVLSLLISSSWLTIASNKGEPPPCTRCRRCREDSWGSRQHPSCCSWSSQAATFVVSSYLYITPDNIKELSNQQLKVRFIITQHLFSVTSNPLHIVWRYIVMQLSYLFQNIVKISLSHFFWTISHDIYLISTHTESPYLWIKVPIGKAIFRWKWHKKWKYVPHKWLLTGK